LKNYKFKESQTKENAMAKDKSRMVIYINSELMGCGDTVLGQKLMDNFFATLGDFANEVSHIALVNSGVKLACSGSPVLENMKLLEESGIEILSCGTCLAHFNLKEERRVGSISNMFSILEVISKAERVLTP
jgi:selenium metabolism protein YedF